MKKSLFIVAFVMVFSMSSYAEDKVKFNFGFEELNNGIPADWHTYTVPGYSISADSTYVHSGKYSMCIESTDATEGFQMIGLLLPDNYDGRSITLSGYIKTENLTGGYAGLFMRIDPKVAFDNMWQRGITGTTGWTRYEITLPMNPAKTEGIVIGGLFSGKGKMWLDDFSVTIDGADISDAEIYKLPVDTDREFDNGSGVEFPKLTQQKINDLELLGRLWGFLKYHHPTIAAGEYNWDYELFRMLPDYLKVKNTKERDKYLVAWIEGLGATPTVDPIPVAEDAHIKPELSWIDGLSPNLRDAVRHIYNNRNQGDNYYIGKSQYGNNLEFTNERSYDEMTYPDAGFRLLSLYRHWNIVQYYYPEKYLTDKDWDDVLREYIPVFLSAKDELEYELAALKLIWEVCDTHADLYRGGDKIDSLRGNNYAPFRVQFVEDKLVVTDYYKPEFKTLDTGDVITKIDGRSVEAIVDSLRPYYPASNEAARLRNISSEILRSQNSVVDIDDKPQQLYTYDSIFHGYGESETEKPYKILDGNIGYIKLLDTTEEEIAEMKNALKNTKGIVLDLRNYPDFVLYNTADYFVSTPKPFVKFTLGSIQNPGMFTFTETNTIVPDGNNYGGKLVVIVNEHTQSRAEFTAMAFRAGENTTIIGSQTAGADGNVVYLFLPGGLMTCISGLGVYYPDGTRTQRIGIVPDIEIHPTIQGIREGRDELLERAVEIINF